MLSHLTVRAHTDSLLSTTYSVRFLQILLEVIAFLMEGILFLQVEKEAQTALWNDAFSAPTELRYVTHYCPKPGIHLPHDVQHCLVPNAKTVSQNSFQVQRLTAAPLPNLICNEWHSSSIGERGSAHATHDNACSGSPTSQASGLQITACAESIQLTSAGFRGTCAIV